MMKWAQFSNILTFRFSYVNQCNFYMKHFIFNNNNNSNNNFIRMNIHVVQTCRVKKITIN